MIIQSPDLLLIDGLRFFPLIDGTRFFLLIRHDSRRYRCGSMPRPVDQKKEARPVDQKQIATVYYNITLYHILYIIK
mgnify:CR=1 FL=1